MADETRELLEQARAIERIYRQDEWKIVEKQLDAHIAFHVGQNERFDLPEKERAYGLGVLWALRWLRELPRNVADQLSIVEAMNKASAPYPGNQGAE